MITRIHEFIDKESISIRKFEQSISASNGLIRKAITNNTDVQSKWIVAIAHTYPKISLDWLIKGEGEMFRNGNANNNFDGEEYVQISQHELNELKMRIENLTSIIESNKALIESQNETIRSKNEIIEMKDQIISAYHLDE